MKEEEKKVIKAFNYLTKKLKINSDFIYYPMSKKQIKEFEGAIFLVSRSDRGSQDKTLFMIHYNIDEINKASYDAIKRHVFHELLHTLTWGFTDEFLEITKYIKNAGLKQELEKRHSDMRETITYSMERKLGPFCLGSGFNKEQKSSQELDKS